jgi:hypothetical protein
MTNSNAREIRVMFKSTACRVPLVMVLVLGSAVPVIAENTLEVEIGAGLYNRYIWRGLDIGSAPSIQPSLSIAYAGLELGVWGAYTLSNSSSQSDEIDFWLSYETSLDNGVSFSGIVTDYYYPNAGIDFFNFNNYDAALNDSTPNPGAHTLEVGLSVTGPDAFPVTVSGNVNVYNDAGNNTYFELSYPVAVNKTTVTFVCGATAGSHENPGYYGTDNFAVINLEVKASRALELSEDHSLPLTVGFILNPNAKVSNLLVGVSF